MKWRDVQLLSTFGLGVLLCQPVWQWFAVQAGPETIRVASGETRSLTAWLASLQEHGAGEVYVDRRLATRKFFASPGTYPVEELMRWGAKAVAVDLRRVGPVMILAPHRTDAEEPPRSAALAALRQQLLDLMPPARSDIGIGEISLGPFSLPDFGALRECAVDELTPAQQNWLWNVIRIHKHLPPPSEVKRVRFVPSFRLSLHLTTPEAHTELAVPSG